MKMTIDEIKKLCVEYCAICGVIFDSPIVIGDQLERTLGYCKYTIRSGRAVPTEIKIAKKLLIEGTLEDIKNVIKHECAHYVAIAITHESHGHDKIFKMYCEKIGTDCDTPKTKIHVAPEKFYRYTVYCPKCGTLVGAYHRNTAKVIKNPNDFTTTCCKENPIVNINW